jgi:hypothetical protein
LVTASIPRPQPRGIRAFHGIDIGPNYRARIAVTTGASLRRRQRDAKFLTIGEATDKPQRIVIAPHPGC